MSDRENGEQDDDISLDPDQADLLGQGGRAETKVALLAQYVRDLSFENPNAPESLQEMANAKPDINVNVQVNARPMGTEGYEVALKISATAKVEKKTSFLVEVDYRGLFGARNVAKEQLEPLLLVECPRIMFPFARRILADATRDGGFPPLLLDPMDFSELYRQQKEPMSAGIRPN